MGTDALRLTGVGLALGQGSARHRVLNDVNLRVRTGEFVVILGPSGSGKSTLLSVMAGLVHADQGEVWRSDHVSDASGGLPGIVFQEPLLLPWATVEDNVALGLRYRRHRHRTGVRMRTADRRAAARALLNEIGIGHLAGRYPDQLSGGQAQRVAVARTIITEPSILLMDEPFGALDLGTRTELQTWLLELRAERDLTVVFVTHDLDEAQLLGDRLVVLNGPSSSIETVQRVDGTFSRSQLLAHLSAADSDPTLIKEVTQ
jgi:ABC-type nitrate/sulfonate/bicarbonate transport system ATPase subunit